MAGLPSAVVERAQEIADALSGHSDIETQAPLRRRISKPEPAEMQLSFLRES
jgi:DNA mismatch repair ATPase MutS